jgi:SAM-dependent methyltransferase
MIRKMFNTQQDILGYLDSIGIRDDETNLIQSQAIKDRIATGKYTQEEYDALSPDSPHNRLFWETIDNNFNHSVLGVPPRGISKEKIDVSQINADNLCLAYQTGIMNVFFTKMDRLRRQGKSGLKVLEIGPGYGCIKNHIKAMFGPELEYDGVDIAPKIPDIWNTNERGTLPDELLKKRDYFDIVVSSNVFQHLSQLQIQEYINEAYLVLREGGYLVFSSLCAYRKGDIITHYGQVTHPYTKEVYIGLLELSGFTVFSVTSRLCDNFNTFVCYKGR